MTCERSPFETTSHLAAAAVTRLAARVCGWGCVESALAAHKRSRSASPMNRRGKDRMGGALPGTSLPACMRRTSSMLISPAQWKRIVPWPTLRRPASSHSSRQARSIPAESSAAPSAASALIRPTVISQSSEYIPRRVTGAPLGASALSGQHRGGKATCLRIQKASCISIPRPKASPIASPMRSCTMGPPSATNSSRRAFASGVSSTKCGASSRGSSAGPLSAAAGLFAGCALSSEAAGRFFALSFDAAGRFFALSSEAAGRFIPQPPNPASTPRCGGQVT
mmetsp:Transcript_11548/g.31469  ORF Transcript_11548/g.31469 Transcript_11548/m.31469 type:complete len:281 (-) Transcript_11548:10-852(-)